MSSRPAVRLQYFNLRARAELSRLLLAAADVQYTDERYSGPPEVSLLYDAALPRYDDLKADTNRVPFAQLPVLVVDGVALPQSHAIERYIAREYGLMGKTSVEAALIDAVLETIEDQKPVWLKQKSDDETLECLRSGELSKSYSMLEAFAERHGDGQHFVGSNLSVADISFYYNHTRFIDALEHERHAQEALQGSAPTLHAIIEAVKANTGIAQWLQKRPAKHAKP